MSFNPESEVQREREHLLKLAQTPGFQDYAREKAKTMVDRRHGLWAPLQDVVDQIPEGPKWW